MQNKDKKDKEEPAENIMDLTFCFETLTIVEEALNKLNYIGNFTYSNSANVMSNSIGQQIEIKMKVQRDLEKKFEDLIIEKSGKTELLEEKKISQLVTQIQSCAEELKKSTNDICKSLSENPDIPKNLLKAKEDKNVIMLVLNDIKEDLINGKTDRFDSTVDNIVRNSIKIEEKRSDEMRLFKHLRNLNEELTKEETEFMKETKNLENRLQAEKKKLAKTKMEENIFKGYRKNQLDALKTLKKTNFQDYEISTNKEIIDKIREKDKIAYLDNQVLDHLKEQTMNLIKEKQRWDNVRAEKENENNNERKTLENKTHTKQKLIEKYQKQISDYDSDIDKLKSLGITLDSTNIQNYLNALKAERAEQNKNKTITEKDEE